MSSSNIENIMVRRQSTDAKSITKGKQINLIGSTENFVNDLILSKDEISTAGPSFAKTMGSKKASEKSK